MNKDLEDKCPETWLELLKTMDSDLFDMLLMEPSEPEAERMVKFILFLRETVENLPRAV